MHTRATKHYPHASRPSKPLCTVLKSLIFVLHMDTGVQAYTWFESDINAFLVIVKNKGVANVDIFLVNTLGVF